MHILWLIGSAALTYKSYLIATESNFTGFLIYNFMAGIFMIMARKERN